MLKDIVEAQARDGYHLWLRFEDGVSGELDIASIIRFEGIFSPLKNRDEFVRVRVNKELGTVEWPCGADLDPDMLYARIAGLPMPQFKNQPLSA